MREKKIKLVAGIFGSRRVARAKSSGRSKSCSQVVEWLAIVGFSGSLTRAFGVEAFHDNLIKTGSPNDQIT